MKYSYRFSLVFIFIIYFHNLSSQNKLSEKNIFSTIIHEQIYQGLKGFYIECEKQVTFFKKGDFIEDTVLKNVPENVLFELEENSDKIFKKETWSDIFFEEINVGSIFLIYKHCLKKNDLDLLFKKNKGRQTIIGISKPIFDNDKKHCIVSLTVTGYPGSIRGNSYFLKKIYGKWVIIEEFGFWMS